MSYSIDIDPRAQATIAALPATALPALAEALAVLELVPWNGRSVNPELNPDGPVRNLPFGAAGMPTYLIVERDQRVDVLLITWAG
ncbi:hypothetical protein [Pseudonocardia sp.]|uniref:hypothetical protein n=1 Tax=Pseudonocardia sp. TaxID=60912 RepID=UPI002633BB0F|nr:hypothetical protein [Pseudonocardia sp.]